MGSIEFQISVSIAINGEEPGRDVLCGIAAEKTSKDVKIPFVGSTYFDNPHPLVLGLSDFYPKPFSSLPPSFRLPPRFLCAPTPLRQIVLFHPPAKLQARIPRRRLGVT